MINLVPRCAALALCASLLPGLAAAAPINTAGTFTPTGLVDFESYTAGTFGPITVGEMTVSASGQSVQAPGFTQFPDIFEG